MPRRRSPHYPGEIKYESVTIRNRPAPEMREIVNGLPFAGYHVETLEDGRRVCITKPGGKQFWGAVQPNDFMVWVYDEVRKDRWRISHSEIYEDIECKLKSGAASASDFIDSLRTVCEGAEPMDLLRSGTLERFRDLPGMSAELVLKAYKWIWIQEDCNYPTGEGRWRSMKALLELRSRYVGA